MSTTFGNYINPLKDIGTSLWTQTKPALHIVGANMFIRENCISNPPEDTYLFFLPTSEPWYHICSISIPDFEDRRPGSWSIKVGTAKSTVVREAVINSMFSLELFEGVSEQKLAWILRFIQKSPKIALSDVLHLETIGGKNAVG